MEKRNIILVSVGAALVFCLALGLGLGLTTTSPFTSTDPSPTVCDRTMMKVNKTNLPVCIEDSDCAVDEGWACFQYICYPWQDDSKIEAKLRKKTCLKDSDCDHDLSCHRHTNRRKIPKGLCMEPAEDCSENGKEDCQNNGLARSCCNGQWCCEDKYFQQLRSLPCASHEGCRSMGYGNLCCLQPSKGNQSRPSLCCNDCSDCCSDQ